MGIEDFIANSISGIITGLNKSAESLKNTGAIINPNMDVNGFMDTPGSRSIAPKSRKVQEIEFNMAVSVNESETDGDGRIGINIVGFNASLGSGSSNVQNNTVSSVKFSVPIAFPADLGK